jgi:hypothetical protein
MEPPIITVRLMAGSKTDDVTDPVIPDFPSSPERNVANTKSGRIIKVEANPTPNASQAPNRNISSVFSTSRRLRGGAG